MSGSSLRAAIAAGLLLVLGTACGESLPAGPPPDIVVFLGDSLIYGGAWREAFPDVDVVNLGVRGDTIFDVSARLDELRNPRVHVAKILLLIGTNDALLRLPGHELAGRHTFLVNRLREVVPDATLVLMTLPPCGADRGQIVRTANDAIRETAAANQLALVDLYPRFAAADGSLREEYSLDGIHLNEAGYALWSEMLAPYVRGDAGAQGGPSARVSAKHGAVRTHE